MAIFIDDIDRCQSTYAVSLLEGILTLFADRRVVYVIAGDRRWLTACFEEVYANFREPMAEPGFPLGLLFVEKAVQLSVAVPSMTPEIKATFWQQLIRRGRQDIPADFRNRLGKAREELASAHTEQEILSRGASHRADPLDDQAWRAAAIERLAKADVGRSDVYFLEPFAVYLEPNPRAMKRLLNAYGVNRDLAVLAGITVLAEKRRRVQLALWTILTMRWPVLESHFCAQARGEKGRLTSEGEALIASARVQSIMAGREVDANLDDEAIRLFSRLSAGGAH